jgi:beta-glucanase (GH16 family)
MKKIIGALTVFIVFISCSNLTSDKNPGALASGKFKTLMWSDEFEYQGLPDTSRWSYDVEGNQWGWGNNELQYYTKSRPDNAWADGNYLHIKAIKEPIENREYSSARLVTRHKGDWLYGRMEIRAKLPGGRGIWPAIWMLPTDWEYGGWPQSGEIDIMEHVGHMADSVFASIHTESYNHVAGTQKTKGFAVPDCESEFHSYILEWDTNYVKVLVDKEHYFSFANEKKTFKEWPFDRRFYLLLNVAVGGNWGGQYGVDDSIFPQEMVVDYVRVYQ